MNLVSHFRPTRWHHRALQISLNNTRERPSWHNLPHIFVKYKFITWWAPPLGCNLPEMTSQCQFTLVWTFVLFCFLNLLCFKSSCLHYKESSRPKPRRSRFQKCDSSDCEASTCTLGKTACADYIRVTSSGRHDISLPTLFCSAQWKMSKVKVQRGKLLACCQVIFHMPTLWKFYFYWKHTIC